MSTSSKPAGDDSIRTEPDTQVTTSTEQYLTPSNVFWVERRRLAEACRDMANKLLCRDHSEADLLQARLAIEALSDSLAGNAVMEGRQSWLEQSRHEDRDAVAVELSPLIGKSSLVGPSLKVWIAEGQGRAEVNFDWRFEGPEKCVHGGYIAAVFDEFLGWAQILSGGSGATKHLSISYHRPTPINTPLVLKAQFVSLQGRKIRVNGEMYAGETLTASCEGLFISFGAKGTTELHQGLESQAGE